MAFERRAGDRHERHDERIDAERDQLLADREDRRFAVAEAGENVSRHLAAPEYRNGGREGLEIPLDADLRLAGHDARAHLLGHRFEVHAERIDAGVAHAREPGVVVRRLALALDRQIDRGLDRQRALGQDRGAAVGPGGVPVVITMWLTPSSSTAALATSASCAGVLRSMVRPAASDWPMAQNWQVLVRL